MNIIFWKILKLKSDIAFKIYQNFKLSKLTSKILAARFENFNDIQTFFKFKTLQSPYIIKDMDKAVTRIKYAIKNKEKIAIFGDYDCDGICASVALYSYLKYLKADVICKIPNRSDGYGLNYETVQTFKSEGVQLLITVDNGITALNESILLQKLKIDLIITDHHNVSESSSSLPIAVAILNPKQLDDRSNFKQLCGAGVVLKLIAAMHSENVDEAFEFAFNFAGDLITLATVADLVPLVLENRVIVMKGLVKIIKTSNLGLKELLKLLFPNGYSKINSTDLAFKICPVINAAGRIKTAQLAFDLLTSNEPYAAKKLATELVQTNELRKLQQAHLLIEVEKFLSRNLNCLKEPVLVVWGKNWPVGLIGLIAGVLVQKFKKPVVVLSVNEFKAVGSARAFESFGVYEALKFCSDLFERWGGHDLAGGLTIRNLNITKFVIRINEFARMKKFAFVFKADVTVKLSELSLNEIKSLKVLEPFGKMNEQPVFALRNLKLLKLIPIKSGTHLLLIFKEKIEKIDVFLFNKTIDQFHFKIGERFNILVQADIYSCEGYEKLSFKLIDLRPSKINNKTFFEGFNLLHNIYIDQPFSTKIVQNKPSLVDFRIVYVAIKNLEPFYGNLFELFNVIYKKINYFKFIIVLKVFIEFNLIVFDGVKLMVNRNIKHVNLKSSKLLKKILYKF